MKIKLFLFLSLFIISATSLFGEMNEMMLRDNLSKAKPGDFLVTAQNKNFTMLIIRSREGEQLNVEEITMPMSRVPNEGIKKAIQTGHWLKEHGKKLLGIRLDSGDLTYLSIKCRQMLDEAGFKDARIMASNELDETLISELKRQGAKIDIWGVGTNLVTGGTQPALDGVYKLSAIRDAGEKWKYKLKLSEQMIKISNPGILQVKRFSSANGYVTDAIYDTSLGINSKSFIVDPLDSTKKRFIDKTWTSKDLLIPIFQKGKCVYQSPPLQEIRNTTQKELAHFHTGIKRFINPHEYIVGMEKALYDIKVNLITAIRSEGEEKMEL